MPILKTVLMISTHSVLTPYARFSVVLHLANYWRVEPEYISDAYAHAILLSRSITLVPKIPNLTIFACVSVQCCTHVESTKTLFKSIKYCSAVRKVRVLQVGLFRNVVNCTVRCKFI